MGTEGEGLYELALFAGGGLGIWGGKLLGFRTVCYVEKDTYCAAVIAARIRDGYFDDAPIWSNVRSFTGRNNQCKRFIRGFRKMAGRLVITGGFPCQPFSTAGTMEGESDERNLWPETIRIIREVRPRFALLENVSGLVSNPYFATILGDLAASGYDCRWDCIPASAVGAPHQRDRVWIMAHAREYRSTSGVFQYVDGRGEQTQADPGDDGKIQPLAHAESVRARPMAEFTWPEDPYPDRQREELAHPHGDGRQALQQPARQPDSLGSGPDLADSDHEGQPLHQPGQQGEILVRTNAPGGGASGVSWWETEPGMGRVVDGLPHWGNRIRTLGQGQVPAVVRTAWRLLRQF